MTTCPHCLGIRPDTCEKCSGTGVLNVAPAQDTTAKPVAWVGRYKGLGINFATLATTEDVARSRVMLTGVAGDGWEIVPLYTAPRTPAACEAPASFCSRCGGKDPKCYICGDARELNTSLNAAELMLQGCKEGMATRVAKQWDEKCAEVAQLRADYEERHAENDVLFKRAVEAETALKQALGQVEGEAARALDTVARALYAKWCHEADHAPEWSKYDKHHSVNPVGLSQYHFIEEAKALLSSTVSPSGGVDGDA